MPATGHFWSTREKTELLAAFKEVPPHITQGEFCRHYAKKLCITPNAVRIQLRTLMFEIGGIIRESPYPRYDEPLVMEGDAIVFPDIEMPFHHAEFINQCLKLAKAWGIRQCIIAGDLLHFDSLSGWEPNWKNTDEGEITPKTEEALVEFAKTLGSRQQAALFGIIGEMGKKDEQDGMSTELKIAREEIKKFEKCFDKIDMALGNHEGRLLRALQTTLNPEEITTLLKTGEHWRIAPFYYSYLISNGEKWCIDHPKSAAASTAAVLASKYECHVLMAHSHHFGITTDISGKYYAAEIGCCVDEDRLPYAAQRHTRSAAHSLGAAIIRGGYPWVLTKFTDWDSLLKIS
jgi:hypothetical protein